MKRKGFLITIYLHKQKVTVENKVNKKKYHWHLFATVVSAAWFNCSFLTVRPHQERPDALVAHKVSLRIFLFALVAQVAHDVQFNYADAFKGAVCV